MRTDKLGVQNHSALPAGYYDLSDVCRLIPGHREPYVILDEPGLNLIAEISRYFSVKMVHFEP